MVGPEPQQHGCSVAAAGGARLQDERTRKQLPHDPHPALVCLAQVLPSSVVFQVKGRQAFRTRTQHELIILHAPAKSDCAVRVWAGDRCEPDRAELLPDGRLREGMKPCLAVAARHGKCVSGCRENGIRALFL